MLQIADWESIGIAAAIAFLAGAGMGGWGAYRIDQARVLEAKAEVSKLQAAYTKRDDDAKQAVLDKQSADRRLVAAIDAKSVAEERLRQAKFANILKENHHAEKVFVASGKPVHFMPIGWVRQYDSSIAASSGQEGGGAGAAASASGGVDSATSDVSEWDVLDNHTINTARCQSWRQQLNDLIDILEKTD